MALGRGYGSAQAWGGGEYILKPMELFDFIMVIACVVKLFVIYIFVRLMLADSATPPWWC